ncbi:MAG: molybdopterin-guanine dinucleotide biosynthesis protein B [Alphaproteobacteria bacterium HGW-Alphaproteobacteria-12]|nr:MAG: molybdopterin-guanine dinucleotide biosynthesis protein B [Alphaproteobacteria bacterium HGW-Alphaproteobacteria-12]
MPNFPNNVFGIVGWKDSGKTTLVEALVYELSRRGFIVSTVKHAHHAFDIDTPGKDSYRHREAGAHEVLVVSRQRWALMHELRETAEPTLSDLLTQLAPCDLVLVEGYKRDEHPKIEVIRSLGPDGRIADTDPTIRAVATQDAALAGTHKRLALDDVAAIADFVCDQCRLTVPSGRG